ncbi:MAG TPA: type II secretion system protein N [Burkholderiales bacterium]|nr:type II secretion system protein N [Burkholderiales bacterium]
MRAAPLALALDLLLLAALGAAAAYFTWVLLAPRAKAAPALGEQARAAESPSPAARRLFGAAAPQAAATGPVRLVGVVSPNRAVFTENGRPRTAAVGESVGDLVVREVHPDHVVVSRRGEIERLTLERRSVPLDAPSGARGNAGK